MKNLEKKFKKVRSNMVQSMNIKEITTYLKTISENLTNLIKKDKETIMKENDNGKYENAFDLINAEGNNNNDQILFLALVTFHHKQGGVVECTFPPKEEIISSDKLDGLIDKNNEKINSKELVLDFILNNLVNNCLIDGIHLVDTDSNFFFIHDLNKIVYCFSYYVQKKTDDKENKIEDDFQENIRGCIQKSICIVSTLPLFGNFLTYENYYTHLSTQMNLYMNQKSLNDKSALTDIYNKLEKEFHKEKKWMFNLPKAFSILKNDLLIILKLILLEKRIIVFSQIPSNVSLLIMTFLSMLPACLSNGKTCFDEQNGTPLKIFHENYLIYPLFTLFDLDPLLEKIKNNNDINFIIGTTNNLVATNKKLNYSCLINIDEQKVQYGECLNESIKIINGREHKFLAKINELLNQSINNENANNNQNNKKSKIDEPWIIEYDHGKTTQLFDSIKTNIFVYYVRILYDISYIISEMKNKYQNDPYKKVLNIHKTINQNYHKSLSQQENSTNEKNDQNENNNIINNKEVDTLPKLEEILADPLPYVIYSVLPIKIAPVNSYSNSDKSKSILEKKKESILVKVNNLAAISEWTKTRNFRRWYCSYKEQIIYHSTLNTKEAHTFLYDINDNYYKGTMLLGRRNGTGEFNYKSEEMIYKGEYKNDLRNGHGKLSSKNGNYYYVGDWFKNKMQGNGILYSSKIGNYTGQFYQNYFEGKGVLTDLENNVYDGMFHKGRKKGKGELRFKNGDVFKGEFKNNKYNGKGVLMDSKGHVLKEGEFKDGNCMKYKKVSNKDVKPQKEDVPRKSKESSKSLVLIPLNENEDERFNYNQQNDSIEENEDDDEKREEKGEEKEEKTEEKAEEKTEEKIEEKEIDLEKAFEDEKDIENFDEEKGSFQLNES